LQNSTTLDSRGYYRIGEVRLDPSQCGPKAFRQHELKSKGFLVPEGIIISYDQMHGLVNEWALTPRDSYAAALQRIQASSQANNYLQSVLEAFDQGQSLILRTAASTEDHPDQAMAGQFVSPAGITTLTDLQQAFAKTWAAAASKNIKGLKLSFLIQEYISTDIGGITFTVSPTAPRANEMAIEVIKGNCAQLTAGHSPDARLVLDWRHQKLKQAIPDALSKEVSSAQILQFGEVFLKLQKYYGCPQDIEWGAKDGTLYIFQSRPVTRVLFHAEVIWTNANFRDGGIGAEMPSPLMWDLYQMTFDHSIKAFSKRYHITPDEPLEAWSGTFLGYPYWNLTAAKSGARKVLGYVERQFDEGQGVTPYYEGDGEVSKLTLKSLFTSLKALLAIRKSIKQRIKVCQQTRAYFKENVRSAFESRPGEAASLAEHRHFFEQLVTQHLMYIYTNYWEIIYDNTFVSTFTQNALARYNRRTGSDIQFTTVTASLERVAHLWPLEALQQLADQIRRDEPALRWWKAEASEAILRKWESDSNFPYRSQLRNFLDRYGYKSTRELEISSPNWAEAPVAVIQTIQQYLNAPTPLYPDKSKGRYEDVQPKLPRRLVRQIEQQRSILWWKEEIRDITTQLFHYIRMAVITLGKKLAAEQLLADYEEAFFLTHQELIDLMGSNATIGHYQERIHYRKNLRDSFRNYQKPDIIFPDEAQERHQSGKHSGLNGIGVCQGTVSGPAIVIAEINENYDPAHLEGCILVTDYINPGHLPYFSNIKGLVTANGGLLSHAAIICRELDIPAVFGIQGVTQKIPARARIQLNGKTGEVAILAE